MKEVLWASFWALGWLEAMEVIPRAHSVHGKSHVATTFGILSATLNTIQYLVSYGILCHYGNFLDGTSCEQMNE
jgi:hypothetical protein